MTTTSCDMEVIRCANEKFRLRLRFDDGAVFDSDQEFDSKQDAFDAMVEWHRQNGMQLVLLQ